VNKKPAGKCPERKPRKLTVNQKAAFQSPIKQPSRADEVVPARNRMGVKVNG
jgi:hypothetical protein